MTDNISNKDKKDWESFVLSKEKLFNKDSKLNTKKFFKKKTIDLHGLTLIQANKIIEEFILKSYEENINQVDSRHWQGPSFSK